MSAAPVSRAMAFRSSRFIVRRTQFRNASTTSEVASKAKETTSEVASKAKETTSATMTKASEGLSKVQASASSTASGAAESAQNAASNVQGRAQRMMSSVQAMVPPTVYYSRVGLELGRLMVQGQKMAPPSVSQIGSYFQPLANVARNPSQISSMASSIAGTPESLLNSMRNMNGKQLATVAIVVAELLGFFTVGEMIGRMKIVGYYGEVHHEH